MDGPSACLRYLKWPTKKAINGPMVMDVVRVVGAW